MFHEEIKRHTDAFSQHLLHLTHLDALTPNTITLCCLVCKLTALYLFTQGHLTFGGIVVILDWWFDALDGALARLRGQETLFGGYLDIVSDHVLKSAWYLAAAYSNHLPFPVAALAIYAHFTAVVVVYFCRLTAMHHVPWLPATSGGGAPFIVGVFLGELELLTKVAVVLDLCLALMNFIVVGYLNRNR